VTLHRRHAGRPQWTGDESLAGRTLLLHAEQGFGDTLQFCRYASLAHDLGATVVIDAPAALAELLGTLRGVSRVVAAGQPAPAFDLHCPMMSLPFAFVRRSTRCRPTCRICMPTRGGALPARAARRGRAVAAPARRARVVGQSASRERREPVDDVGGAGAARRSTRPSSACRSTCARATPPRSRPAACCRSRTR
jgi:hypothetical protein